MGLRTGFWALLDLGITGSGSVPDDRLAVLLPVGGAAFVAALGVVVLVEPARRALLVLTVAGAASMPVVLAAYPQPEPAVLVAHDPETGALRWRIELPVNEVFGHQGFADGHLVLEGRKDRHECGWELRAITIVATSGEIVDVTELPTEFAGPGDLPPEPQPLDDLPFVVEPGDTPWVCSS